MTIRLTDTQWQALYAHLVQRRDIETAAILLARAVRRETDDLLLVEEVVLWPESAYLHRSGDHIRLDPAELTRVLKPARERGLSVVTVHSHPGCDDAWFSAADDAGDDRLMPALRCQIPAVPHGSVVVSGAGRACARLMSRNGSWLRADIVVVGLRCDRITGVPNSEAGEREDRQRLALGAYGQACLRRACVGIVGLGGIGSEVSKTLAHLGVGTLRLIDGDVVEESNLPRLVGANPGDVVAATPKVDVAQRYARSIASPSRVISIPESLCADVDRLADCDIIVSCVDLHTPRSILNAFAYRMRCPVIDTGVAFRVDPSGALVGDAGRVVVVGPGRPCLACWGHVNPVALREEALSEGEREALTHEGYVSGANVRQPAVMCFNGIIANAAVVEVLRLLAGFAHGTIVERLTASFTGATVKPNALIGAVGCRICGSHRRQSIARPAERIGPTGIL